MSETPEVIALAKAVLKLMKVDDEWPVLGVLAARVETINNTERRRADRKLRDAVRAEHKALCAFIAGVDELFAAYEALPFDVRFPLGGAA